ncbi:Ribonuclease R [Acaryochloris thomasi RCC1774]|uniref:Ribonuclease R n=1 Tax=Acaryochloris thomasi RCC1774 TaxID=1764569 RepID=A0A2W1JJK5_9CYAN|nr:RNB domain-containing ribonuclease [Acaryochloris thomasi]PZD70444.1 Ribonuclease R [Acaryochloris thomasi RCC1774]
MPQLLFSAPVLTQAKTIATHPHHYDRPQVQGFTIDGPTSLDLDDAIWLEETETGATLQVHISDVSEHIPPGTPLDESAIATTRSDTTSRATIQCCRESSARMP